MSANSAVSKPTNDGNNRNADIEKKDIAVCSLASSGFVQTCQPSFHGQMDIFSIQTTHPAVVYTPNMVWPLQKWPSGCEKAEIGRTKLSGPLETCATGPSLQENHFFSVIKDTDDNYYVW